MFNITFDQFNAAVMNKTINYLKEILTDAKHLNGTIVNYLNIIIVFSVQTFI